MCTHANVKKFKRQAKELRLLQKVIQKADMSLLSNCLQCVRTGADSRYVTVAASHRLQLGRSFQFGSDVALMRAAVGEARCRLLVSKLKLREQHGNTTCLE